MLFRLSAHKASRFISSILATEADTLPYPKVSLNYWRPKQGSTNFGDQLSYVITALMLAKNGFTLQDESCHNTELLAVGSVLHLASEGATVWGSGVNGKIDERLHKFKNLDVRAVRGPLTLDFLKKRSINVPEVFGDPALLLPLLAKERFVRKNDYEVGFVPNLNDIKNNVSFDLAENVHFINPMQSWHRCIEQILRCSFILSTSLHGLVIADSYGIPARYIRLSQYENIFKYQDYYEGTGRPDFEFATSIAQGLEMRGEKPLRWNAQKLLDAFPYDLWLS